MKTSLKIAIMTLAFFTSYPLNAQEWSANFCSSTCIDDNIFNNYTNIQDVYTAFFVNVMGEYLLNSKNLKVRYDGTASLFKKYSERNFSFHNLGSVLTIPFNNGDKILNVGGNAYIGNYQDIFNMYDYMSVKGFTSLKQKVLSNSSIIGGVNLEIKKYPNLRVFDNGEIEFFTRWRSSFRTGTTVMTGLSFAHEAHFSHGTPGYLAEGIEFFESSNRSYAEKVKYELQFIQSITDLTGINLSYAYSYPLKACGHYIVSTTGAVLLESELFNDPFAYTLQRYSAQMTRLFPKDLTLVLSGGLLTKDFFSHPVYTLKGDLVEPELLRHDQRKYFSASVEKKYNSDNSNRNITVHLNFLRLLNNSNDSYYEYTNNLFNVNFSYNF